MDFSYEASGSLSLTKCGTGYIFTPEYVRSVVFSVGDQAWLAFKAQKGILESIVIKKIRIFPVLYRGLGPSTVIYIDTFNALYNEDDLLSYQDAFTLATNYLNNLILEAERAKCLQ